MHNPLVGEIRHNLLKGFTHTLSNAKTEGFVKHLTRPSPYIMVASHSRPMAGTMAHSPIK